MTQKTKTDHAMELVEVELFEDSGKYTGNLFVNVNNHSWSIPRGKPVKVPRYVGEVIAASAKQDKSTAKLISRLSGEYNGRKPALEE